MTIDDNRVEVGSGDITLEWLGFDKDNPNTAKVGQSFKPRARVNVPMNTEGMSIDFTIDGNKITYNPSPVTQENGYYVYESNSAFTFVEEGTFSAFASVTGLDVSDSSSITINRGTLNISSFSLSNSPNDLHYTEEDQNFVVEVISTFDIGDLQMTIDPNIGSPQTTIISTNDQLNEYRIDYEGQISDSGDGTSTFVIKNPDISGYQATETTDYYIYSTPEVAIASLLDSVTLNTEITSNLQLTGVTQKLIDDSRIDYYIQFIDKFTNQGTYTRILDENNYNIKLSARADSTGTGHVEFYVALDGYDNGNGGVIYETERTIEVTE